MSGPSACETGDTAVSDVELTPFLTVSLGSDGMIHVVSHTVVPRHVRGKEMVPTVAEALRSLALFWQPVEREEDLPAASQKAEDEFIRAATP
jgi:hypothetical protein